MQHGIMIALLIVGSLAAPITQALAQNTRDFTGQTPSVSDFIETLRGADPAPTMRGLGPIEADPVEPRCEYYHGQATREAAIVPESDIAQISVTFDFNSAELSSDATGVLHTLGTALASKELAAGCFQIEGHTDGVGTNSYNLDLSHRRAQSVARYLQENFKLNPDRLLPVGYGEDKPIAGNETEAGRQKNRRVEIANLGSGK